MPPRAREGHIDAIVARLGKRNLLAVPRSSLSAGLQLGLLGKPLISPLFRPMSSIGGAGWPQTRLSMGGIVRTLFHRKWGPWGSRTGATPNCSFHYCTVVVLVRGTFVVAVISVVVMISVVAR